MLGKYNFYQEGKLIYSCPNIITDTGKKVILRYLADMTGSLAQSIAFGVGESTPQSSDSHLTYEVDRANILLKTTDYNNNYILFKTTLDIDKEYTIYELGTYSLATNPLSGGYGSKILASFDSDIEAWSNTVVDSTQARTSAESCGVNVAAGSTVSTRLDVDMDLSGYAKTDEFLVAVYNDGNVSSVDFVFGDGTNTNTATIDFSTVGTGYQILSVSKSGFTGSADWASITSMGLDITAGASDAYLILDGIRVEDTNTINPDYALISHSLASSPQVKIAKSPLDIEYALLELNFT